MLFKISSNMRKKPRKVFLLSNLNKCLAMCGRENEKVSNMQYTFDQFAELQIVSNINQKV